MKNIITNHTELMLAFDKWDMSCEEFINQVNGLTGNDSTTVEEALADSNKVVEAAYATFDISEDIKERVSWYRKNDNHGKDYIVLRIVRPTKLDEKLVKVETYYRFYKHAFNVLKGSML